MITLDPVVHEELHRRANAVKQELRQQIDAVAGSDDPLDTRRSMAMQMVLRRAT